MRKDLRSPLAKLRDKWMLSEEGRTCRTGQPSGHYLDNRLERAFLAGVKAAEELMKEQANAD